MAHYRYKLAPYGTDGRLITTDVYAKFKVTQKLLRILKIRLKQI